MKKAKVETIAAPTATPSQKFVFGRSSENILFIGVIFSFLSYGVAPALTFLEPS